MDKEELMYVELPNLLHRILKKSMLHFPKNERRTEIIIDEIKKITNAECESALATFKH